MRLYRFTLPMKDNAGVTMTLAYVQFRRFLLNTLGGYTETATVEGAWTDKGQVYRDKSWTIEAACERDQYAPILEKVRELWPDQLSLFVADVGEAYFIPGLAAAPAEAAPAAA